ncbi:MAG: glucose-6-phosphate isomerase [SAR324 cluster bacterium]|nr:glucose-6-phosphate isomerase [SAR324 cluster bacterium]
MKKLELWQRYQKYLNVNETVGLALDISHMQFSDNFLKDMEKPMQEAFGQMQTLEAGAIANPDENRMVGHYWLRSPELAPTEELCTEIKQTVAKIKRFSADIHQGVIKTPDSHLFENVLLVGIGGSALGPQFVYQALGKQEGMNFFTFDNTDPEGIDQVLGQIGQGLQRTLVLVISKSGGTKETRNGMLEAKAAYEKAGLDFSKYTVAVTGTGSALEQTAQQDGWLEIFPMWDWVGGRTSELSAVGLLPAALLNIDINAVLKGAADMDEITRQPQIEQNPAALLALMWYYAGDGKGKKDMVIIPYKDRLIFLSRYLQQLIMESLGKEKDVSGNNVYQGIVVYGNKGSTDQHAYVQQLREGLSDFFVTFVQVLQEREGRLMEVEPGITAGDYLQGFLLGTEQALYENERESLTITLNEVNETSIGALIALYERAVGLYASLIHINAYHQPGVEAGKKAAGTILGLQTKVLEYLKNNAGRALTLEDIAAGVGQPEELGTIFKILDYLAYNDRGIEKKTGSNYCKGTYQA